MKPREEVEALKAQYVADPIWEIWDTEGFEDDHDELLEWAEKQEAFWERQNNERKQKRATAIGSTLAMIELIEKLEYQLARAQERLDRLESI